MIPGQLTEVLSVTPPKLVAETAQPPELDESNYSQYC